MDPCLVGRIRQQSPRKCYELTRAGRKRLEAEQDWERLPTAVALVLRMAND
jgi:DNA-binding PadR family transcriptional regulator